MTMIDIKLIRKDPDRYVKAAKLKNFEADIPALLDIDRQLADIVREHQDVRTAQNAAGKEIASLTGREKEDAIARMAQLKARVKDLEDKRAQLQPEFDQLMLLVSQPPADDVPIGADDTENVEIRRAGEVPEFDFPPADHIELGRKLDIIDVPRGVKLAGSRNYALKGAGAMLHYAVLRFAMDSMIARGYEILNLPILVNDEIMYGTGYFPLGRDDAYLCERDGMSLIGTAEVPLTAFHSNEVLDCADLPKKYVATSTCFRREAGAAGKDTHGLYRIHLFDKVEQVVICRNDEKESLHYHHEILANAEAVLAALKLPYRVVNVCTGDLGQGQVQKFDIEAWMPSRGNYGETHSASRFHDFQARRLNIRYREQTGKVNFVHTLNNTVIASPRILIPMLELYQNADGSVTVPQVLRAYMGGLEKIEPSS